MAPSKPQSKPAKGIEQLLSAQTTVILNAVEVRLAAHEGRIDQRMDDLERRFMEKVDRLTTTLDKFLKRMTDMEQEFTFMKHDVKRIKAVLREKLGVAID